MTSSSRLLRVFIGSSSEGLKYAMNLQAVLELHEGIEVVRWDTGTFDPGGITLDSLVDISNKVDFAILIATGEDTVTTRGEEMAIVRDNIIFEFGLFMGTIGRERVYLLNVGEVKLPTDISGLTRLTFQKRSDGDIKAGLNDAGLKAERVMRKLGNRPIAETSRHSLLSESPRESASANATHIHLTSDSRQGIHNALDQEIDLLCSNAVSQGWVVTKRNATLLRLQSPKGKEFAFKLKRPVSSRVELRSFVATLRANGLRVNHALQRSPESSPFS